MAFTHEFIQCEVRLLKIFTRISKRHSFRKNATIFLCA